MKHSNQKLVREMLLYFVHFALSLLGHLLHRLFHLRLLRRLRQPDLSQLVLFRPVPHQYHLRQDRRPRHCCTDLPDLDLLLLKMFS